MGQDRQSERGREIERQRKSVLELMIAFVRVSDGDSLCESE